MVGKTLGHYEILEPLGKGGMGEVYRARDILLNLAVSDGRRAVVSRFISGDPNGANTLYFHQGRQYRCQDGVCAMITPDHEGPAVIVASEPLSEDPGWTSVAPNHMGGGPVGTRPAPEWRRSTGRLPTEL